MQHITRFAIIVLVSFSANVSSIFSMEQLQILERLVEHARFEAEKKGYDYSSKATELSFHIGCMRLNISADQGDKLNDIQASQIGKVFHEKVPCEKYWAVLHTGGKISALLFANGAIGCNQYTPQGIRLPLCEKYFFVLKAKFEDKQDRL